MSFVNNNDNIEQLAVAMCKVQAEIENVVKEADNPFFRTKYADLGSILAYCRPILSKYGLSIIQFPVGNGDKVGVETTILHESGQNLSETIFIPMPVDAKNVPQAVGSIISYLRRYAYAAAVGIAQVDDDAQSLTAAAVRPSATDNITSEQIKSIVDLEKSSSALNDTIRGFLREKGKSLNQLTREEGSKLIAWANNLARVPE